MLLHLIICACTGVLNLNNLKIFNEFVDQCQSQHTFIGSLFNLKQLVVVFRHGDRMPLKSVGAQWKDKKCMLCDSGCALQSCRDGMLSEKGYAQAVELGRFIKKFYIPLLSDPKQVHGFHSTIGRTLTTLKGVFQGIGMPSLEEEIEDSLINTANANQVKSLLSQYTARGNVKNYNIYDNAIASLCSNTMFDCSTLSCNPRGIYDLMKSQEKQLLENIEKTRANLTANGVSLGRFGNFIKEAISKRNNVVLVSGHDSTLIKLLIGLNINLDRIPAYTSAVFLEVWQHPNGKEFVRVIYNGRIQKIGLYGEEYVEFDKFITYLTMFSQLNSILDEITEINSNSKQSYTKINEIAESAIKIYKPLITELKNREIIQDSSYLVNNIETVSKISLKRIVRSMMLPVKQFLFEGWFQNGKKIGPVEDNKTASDKNNKIEIKLEIKDKDSGSSKYQMIECDKNASGDCHAVINTSDSKSDTIKADANKHQPEDSNKCEKSQPKSITDCESENASGKCESENVPSKCESKNAPRKCESENASRKCESENAPRKCESENVPTTPSCQVKAMLESTCNGKTPLTQKTASCRSENHSAFEGLPVSACKRFDSKECGNLNPLVQPFPSIENQSSTLPNGQCRNPIPGVQILS